MAKPSSTGPAWKPMKGMMTGREFGKAVSTAAKTKGMMKKPPKGRPPVSR